MFVTSFWFSRKIKDYSSYELNYTEVLHSSVYGLYCDKTKLFLISWAEFSRPHGAWLLTSFESRQYMPVIKQRQLAHLKTTFIDETFFLLAIKKYALKKSFKFRLQPQKKNSVIFTYRRRSTPNYYVWCVTSQYFFRIHFFASKGLSECPAYLYNYINLLLSSFFVQMQVVRRSLSLSVKIIYYQVLRDKKKEPAMFWSANFPRLPRQFT